MLSREGKNTFFEVESGKKIAENELPDEYKYSLIAYDHQQEKFYAIKS